MPWSDSSRHTKADRWTPTSECSHIAVDLPQAKKFPVPLLSLYREHKMTQNASMCHLLVLVVLLTQGVRTGKTLHLQVWLPHNNTLATRCIRVLFWDQCLLPSFCCTVYIDSPITESIQSIITTSHPGRLSELARSWSTTTADFSSNQSCSSLILVFSPSFMVIIITPISKSNSWLLFV